MLSFSGIDIFPHAPLTSGDPEFARQRTHFFGVEGTSEIYGGEMLTPWSVSGWITGTSAQAVSAQLNSWMGLVASNDSIVETGLITRTIPNCTLDSFAAGPEGILPFLGEGSALNIAKGSFYCECRWQWTQLGVGWL